MGKNVKTRQRVTAYAMSAVMLSSLVGILPQSTVNAQPQSDSISNGSLKAQIGDLGQISSLQIKNNRTNNNGGDVNFVLPNDTAAQNNEAHQWMGEMIFSYRTSKDGDFAGDNSGFVEVDTNKTLAAGGLTTYSNASENLKDNPYIEKTATDDKVTVKFKGQDEDSTDERTMKGFDVTSEYDMGTDDGSMQWNITLENTGGNYIEFGDVGLPMPWNSAYSTIDDTYNNRVTVHTYAGADSGYAYAIRCSGEGNYMLFTPVTSTGAKIEYIDNWIGNVNGVKGTRSGSLYSGWTSDSGTFYPGLQVYYIHSKDIQKTGKGYFTDASSLVLKPGEKKTYSFKFSAVRAGDNSPQNSASDHNNSSDSVEERENNMRSILYREGLIDAVAVPGFQTAINMSTKLDLHYDESQVSDVSVDVQCIHENDPWDEKHIPQQTVTDDGINLVNNSRSVEHGGDATAELVETKTVNGETHHIYNIDFKCIGNNSVRINYKSNGEQKFTQFEFNVLDELNKTINAHSDFAAAQSQDNDENSETYGIYSDWYFASGRDSKQQDHWGDDWSHDNINFMAMKNYLDPKADEIESIEKYLIDFMWDNYMKNTQDSYTVANYLRNSGIYSDASVPYTRTYSEVMEATGFFNMYRIEKAYHDLIEYRKPAEWYLEKAYGIYINRVNAYEIGYYGEQQIPQMIEALYDEGMDEEAEKLQNLFAKEKGTNMTRAAYPYGSEFEYDNTGEEGAYSAAKALRKYYPDSSDTDKALSQMEKAEWKTRAMRGLQPTWYQYADPVFRGGETWWNFQYTASLAGYIMDDWLRYEDTTADADETAWSQRMNYAAKLSNFNAINMGQISSEYIGNTSWRYTMSKGGVGAQDVNDRGTRVMNNGWNDFSGESDEGIYGSLLSISSDVVTDPIFGLTGYGCNVSKSGDVYTVTPLDGIGKRINIIDGKVYVELEQDSCTQAVINKNGAVMNLTVNNTTGKEHLLKISLSGAGVGDGYYDITAECGDSSNQNQCYVKDNEGTAYVVVPEGESAQISITKKDGGENEEPKIYDIKTDENPQALTAFNVKASAYDDGAPSGRLTYKWENVEKPEGAEVSFTSESQTFTDITASLDGEYKFKLTVNDGKLSTEKTITVNVGRPDEKKAPVIDKAEAVQDNINTTTAKLNASATADTTYENTLTYQWKVADQPEGTKAVIADADKADAVMKAYTPGEYTLELTVTDKKTGVFDEDTVTTKQVTVDMTGDVDGIDRTDTIITGKGEKPSLPDTMEIVHPDGTLAADQIVWDEIPEDSYNNEGTFSVSGTVKGTELRAIANVMVVSGKKVNAALSATASAIVNTPEDLGGVAGLNDGYEPAGSRDTSHGVWHNWLGGNQSGDAWVEYDWDKEIVICQSDAYYFTDGNFAPKSVSYQYKDSNGNWQDVKNAKGLGVELDKYNTTTFTPVKTTAIRMIMSPKTLGCGVIEWKVWGYSDNTVDKQQLRQVIDHANALDLDLFALTDDEKEAFKAQIKEAQQVSDDKEADQTAVDIASEKLAKAITRLSSEDGNLAYSATASTSYVSGWESLAAVKDGKTAEKSYNTNWEIPKYGSWGNVSSSESITYTWDSAVELQKADIYFWYDGEEGSYTSGGIKVPADYVYEYLDGNGNWQKVSTESSYEKAMDQFNTVEFTPVKTTAIRVTMQKQAKDNNGVGVIEWKVYGASVKADKTELAAAIEAAKAVDGTKYTKESYDVLISALEEAQKVMDDDSASDTQIKNAAESLNAAKDALEKAKDKENLALDAKAEGICDYTNDLGGVAALNNGVEPSSSNDKSALVWHNWNDRYEAGTTTVQNAWLSYSWDEEVVLDSTDVYYFTDFGGIMMPKEVKFEYKDADGNWNEIKDAKGLGCEADKYNTTELGQIKTTALRMVMVPQEMSEADPVHGVGVIEWKVKGKYVKDIDNTDPQIEGAEDGKTYCNPVKIKVTDENLDTVTIKVNGENETTITLDEDGCYEVGAAEGTQTITAKDRSGNTKTLTIRVNNGHTGKIADCHTKAICEVCGEEYGEFNPDVHTGGTEVKNAKAATVKEEGYTGDTYCRGCGEIISKGEAIEKIKDDTAKDDKDDIAKGDISYTTVVDEKAPATKIDVDEEKLIGKLVSDKTIFSDEERAVIAAGGKVNLKLTVSDITESVSKEDKEKVSAKLSDGKIGMYLDINLFAEIYKADGSAYKADKKIAEPGESFSISVTIPVGLLDVEDGFTRTFHVIRVHDGVAEILDTAYNEKSRELTFKTDRFSTYAIAYTDKADDSENDVKDDSKEDDSKKDDSRNDINIGSEAGKTDNTDRNNTDKNSTDQNNTDKNNADENSTDQNNAGSINNGENAGNNITDTDEQTNVSGSTSDNAINKKSNAKPSANSKNNIKNARSVKGGDDNMSAAWILLVMFGAAIVMQGMRIKKRS